VFILLTVSCTTLHSERYQNISTFNPRYVRAIHFPISDSPRKETRFNSAFGSTVLVLLFLRGYSSTYRNLKKTIFFIMSFSPKIGLQIDINVCYADAGKEVTAGTRIRPRIKLASSR
jgi:hypothetical protein